MSIVRSPNNNAAAEEPLKWKGRHAFYIAGTGHDDDTIRIPSSHRKDEYLYKLVLPTLCLTYADMAFANDVGGVQAYYPDSKVYGSKYFDPPVEINGAEKIEKFTWIRGAERVTIGPKETIIEWRGFRDLVIPKLRIKAKEKVQALLNFPEMNITVNEPFKATVRQYTDGRHVGGIQVTKRHPNWKPEPDRGVFDLFVRVIDGKTRQAVPEARIRLFTWDNEKGGFVSESTWYTNTMGIVDAGGLPCSDKKLLTVSISPWKTETWRFRPLSGQKVKKFFRLWKPVRTRVPYKWGSLSTLKVVSVLTDTGGAEILRMNRLRSERGLAAGRVVTIPCFEGIYHVTAGETLEKIAQYFCYRDAEELAGANRLKMPAKLYLDQELKLPGWKFFKAVHGGLFKETDRLFGIPAGWSRPAQRTLHDDPKRAYEDEIIAVPSSEFVKVHKLKKLY